MIRRCFYLLTASLVVASAGAEFPVRPGDRIAIVGNTFADQLRIHGYLETLLLQRSIENPVSIRNLGWAGDMLTARDRPTHFPTEESTLRAHKTDVIIACFGMGESFAGEKGLDDFRKDLNDWIASHKGKSFNGHSEVRLILISPIAYEDLGGLTPHQERRNRELASYTRAMQETAEKAGLPFVDLNKPTARLMADSVAPKLTGNGVNLNAYGYWSVSRTLADALLPGGDPWRLEVDARTGKASARGVRITGVRSSEDGVSFTVEEQNWPALSAPTRDIVHRELESVRDTLRVANLKPGAYRLEVDGEEAAVADHDEWAVGVPLEATPAHRALRVYREAVNDKNLQFVYSWKALNQVHIVGERRKSASGRALPAEIVEFNRIANEKDAALAKGIELGTRIWRLTRIQ